MRSHFTPLRLCAFMLSRFYSRPMQSSLLPCPHHAHYSATSGAGYFGTARNIYIEGGVSAFYRGVAPCALRGFPANGALFLGVWCTNRMFKEIDAYTENHQRELHN